MVKKLKTFSKSAVKCALRVCLALMVLMFSDFETTAREKPQELMEVGIDRKAALPDLISHAWRENPGVEAERQKWKAVAEKYRLADAYPDPQLMINYFPEPIETRLGPQNWNVTVSQTIPFPGTVSKSSELTEIEAYIRRLGLDKAFRDLAVEVKISFHELYYLRKAREIAKRQTELINHLRKVVENAHAQDRALFMDAVKAQSQLGRTQYDAILFHDLEMTETARMNGLLNRPPEAAIGELEEFKPPLPQIALKDIYRLAEVHRKEVRMAEAKVKKAAAGRELAELRNLPSFRLGLFYGAIGEPDMDVSPSDAGRDVFGIQFGMSLPIWPGKNRGRVDMASAEIAVAKAAKAEIVNKTRAEISSLWFRLRNSGRLVTLYRNDLIPQTAKAMETIEIQFKEGEAGFSDFIETQSVWYNFQLALTRAEADYGKCFARLEGLVGRKLSSASASEKLPAKETK